MKPLEFNQIEVGEPVYIVHDGMSGFLSAGWHLVAYGGALRGLEMIDALHNCVYVKELDYGLVVNGRLEGWLAFAGKPSDDDLVRVEYA